MRVERFWKSWLFRYERGSVLLFARNAYAIQEALLIQRVLQGAGGGNQLAQVRARLVEGKLIYPDRPPLGKKHCP